MVKLCTPYYWERYLYCLILKLGPVLKGDDGESMIHLALLCMYSLLIHDQYDMKINAL